MTSQNWTSGDSISTVSESFYFSEKPKNFAYALAAVLSSNLHLPYLSWKCCIILTASIWFLHIKHCSRYRDGVETILSEGITAWTEVDMHTLISDRPGHQSPVCMSADPSLFFNSQNSFFPALTNSKFLYLKEKRKIEKKIAYVTTIILHFSVCVIRMCVYIYTIHSVHVWRGIYIFVYICYAWNSYASISLSFNYLLYIYLAFPHIKGSLKTF